MLTDVRILNTKKARNGNTRYLRCSLEDFTGTAKCVMWPDDFLRYKDEVSEDRVCFVRGVVERTREEPGLILSRILSLEQAQRELTTGLILSLSLDLHGPQHVDAVAQILRRTPGHCPVFLSIRDASGKRTLLKSSEEFRINPTSVATAD